LRQVFSNVYYDGDVRHGAMELMLKRHDHTSKYVENGHSYNHTFATNGQFSLVMYVEAPNRPMATQGHVPAGLCHWRMRGTLVLGAAGRVQAICAGKNFTTAPFGTRCSFTIARFSGLIFP
jgi:hypothetical protein